VRSGAPGGGLTLFTSTLHAAANAYDRAGRDCERRRPPSYTLCAGRLAAMRGFMDGIRLRG